MNSNTASPVPPGWMLIVVGPVDFSIVALITSYASLLSRAVFESDGPSVICTVWVYLIDSAKTNHLEKGIRRNCLRTLLSSVLGRIDAEPDRVIRKLLSLAEDAAQ